MINHRINSTLPVTTTRDKLVGVTALMALATIFLEFGWYKPPIPLAILHGVQLLAIAVFLGSLFFELFAGRGKEGVWRRRLIDLAALTTALVFLAAWRRGTLEVLLKVSTAYVVARGTLRIFAGPLIHATTNLFRYQSNIKPGFVMMMSFALTIFIGGSLLALPKAMAPQHTPVDANSTFQRLVNSYFTATSATCVTGLVVYDTGKDYTFFGQIVILVLIQVGGLGIMVFGGVFGVLARKQSSLLDTLALQDTVSHETVGEVRSVVRFMVISTFLCEAIGAVLLYPMWPVEIGGTGERIFRSVFHAISAFCNAGFALHSENLVPYRREWQVYGVIMPLIVIGGLGFPVLSEIVDWTRRALRQRAIGSTTLATLKRGMPYRFSLHTRLVIIATLFLIIVPAFVMFGFESSRQHLRLGPEGGWESMNSAAMSKGSVAEKFLGALFQSVTCRTAGFNTVPTDLDSMTPATHFLMCLLMFVGGSPASTAGGVKTTSMMVLLLGVMNTLGGRDHVEAFGRSIPDMLVRRAALIVFLMFSAVSTATMAVLWTDPGASIREVLFEVISAICTVGLSTGLTPRLTYAARIIVLLVMFLGRIGPLTLLVAIASRRTRGQYQYPQESVLIG